MGTGALIALLSTIITTGGVIITVVLQQSSKMDIRIKESNKRADDKHDAAITLMNTKHDAAITLMNTKHDAAIKQIEAVIKEVRWTNKRVDDNHDNTKLRIDDKHNSTTKRIEDNYRELSKDIAIMERLSEAESIKKDSSVQASAPDEEKSASEDSKISAGV